MNATFSQLVQIPADAGVLEGMLELPANPRGVVLFAHGSGSSRFSPRNNFVAEKLREGRRGSYAASSSKDRSGPEKKFGAKRGGNKFGPKPSSGGKKFGGQGSRSKKNFAPPRRSHS